jgi:hypothetical protein
MEYQEQVDELWLATARLSGARDRAEELAEDLAEALRPILPEGYVLPDTGDWADLLRWGWIGETAEKISAEAASVEAASAEMERALQALRAQAEEAEEEAC